MNAAAAAAEVLSKLSLFSVVFISSVLSVPLPPRSHSGSAAIAVVCQAER